MKVLLLTLALLFGAIGAASAVPLTPLPGGDRVIMSYEAGLEGPARELEASAEDTLSRIAKDLPDLPLPRVVHIQLVRDASSFASVAPDNRGAPAYAVGVTYPDLGVVTVAMRRGAELVDPRATLDHELGHVALGAALGDRAPHWLHEGFAYQHSAEWSMARSETLAGMVWMRGIIPIEQLDRSFPAEESPAQRAYAESYDFVNFLSRRGRWEDAADDGDRWPFRRFLREIGQGASLDTAAKHQFGKNIHELFEEWRDDVRGRYIMAPAAIIGVIAWVLVGLMLMLAWRRKRKLNRIRIAQWDFEERLADQRRRAEEAEQAERLRSIIRGFEEPPPDPKLWN
ncbi:hypothetical protein BH11MYX1_BH11MYX1_16760 [soil metagenome]